MKAFQVLYALCFTRPRYQVSVYRTTGPLVSYAYTKDCRLNCMCLNSFRTSLVYVESFCKKWRQLAKPKVKKSFPLMTPMQQKLRKNGHSQPQRSAMFKRHVNFMIWTWILLFEDGFGFDNSFKSYMYKYLSKNM